MNQIFFTADTHFGHANIIRYCKRPWIDWTTDVMYDSGLNGELTERWTSLEIARQRAQEMDKALIANWNSVVGRDDLVYHLGDFCFGKTEEDFRRYHNALNGRIVFLKGNHDKLAWKYRTSFLQAHDCFLEIEINGVEITLCHYALRVWNKSHIGTWHLYGHSHGKLPDDPTSRSLDVGVDCHNYTPLSFEQVAVLMAKKAFKPMPGGR